MANRLLFLALLLSLTGPAAWAQTPVGPEFQVNSYTTGYQLSPAVASDPNGNFVVVWGGRGAQDTSGVFGQRFDASGLPQGSEFLINSFTTVFQAAPAVASDTNGNFVVVWESGAGGSGQDGSSFGVFGQRFNASGVPQGSEFQVNSYTPGSQYNPAVASDANGNFVVVWQSAYQDGFQLGVFGQRFNASGVPQGSEFRVNSYTTGDQRAPVVASDANGNFVVVWESPGDGSALGVFGQRFNAPGVPQGSEFRINSHTTDNQRFPGLASASNGNFVVVWASENQDGSAFGVFGQRFNASGVPQGTEFQVNSYTPSNQISRAVASDPNGNFVVLWESYGQDGSTMGVFGQRFNASGPPQGTEFQVNSYTPRMQTYPAVASDANGNFVVAWHSNGQYPTAYNFGIFGQRYSVDLIFKNGFE